MSVTSMSIELQVLSQNKAFVDDERDIDVLTRSFWDEGSDPPSPNNFNPLVNCDSQHAEFADVSEVGWANTTDTVKSLHSINEQVKNTLPGCLHHNALYHIT